MSLSRRVAGALAAVLLAVAACSGGGPTPQPAPIPQPTWAGAGSGEAGAVLAGAEAGAGQAAWPADRASTFVLGDTTFNPENEEGDVNPHHAYSGWAAVRYGLAETLFRYTDAMGLEPWLATGATRLDERTWQVTVRDGVAFANGRELDAMAVKECLEDLVAVHARAAADLALDSVDADGQVLILRTTRPVPTLLAHLADPYSAVIDMEAPVADGLVVGTGPYQAVSLQPGKELGAVANERYWAGTPGFAALRVLTIEDGNTLMMALRAGQVDAAYGLPYATYPALTGYRFSQALTSRTFMLAANMDSPVMADPAVRRALAQGIDKDGFVAVLGGNGQVAAGPFPSAPAGGAQVSEGVGPADAQVVTAPGYDPLAATTTLEAAGWRDTDGDGVREKDGRELAITWLTYPTRQELPLLAEWAQASLERIGFRVRIEATSEHTQRRTDPTAWDVYASAMVTDPTGDPAYFFTTRATSDAVANYGHYRSPQVDALAEQLAATFPAAEREAIGAQMAQQVVDDGAFVFVTHLTMGLVAAPDVVGLDAHPSDVYEVTADLHREEGR